MTDRLCTWVASLALLGAVGALLGWVAGFGGACVGAIGGQP